MKRLLRVLHRAALAGAVVASTLFFLAWMADDVRVVSDYGFGSGPGRHSGWGAFAQVVFLALPAACALVLSWAAALVLRLVHHEPVPRFSVRVTATIGAVAAAVVLSEQVLDAMGDRERAREESARAAVDHVAADHDALAAYVQSHDPREPLTPGGPTPLGAALARPFPDLVAELLARGALPTEDDLVQAAHTGDVALVRSLLAQDHGLRGGAALSDAFSRGDADMLAVLAAARLDVAGTLPRLMDPTTLSLHEGEVDWEALRARWQGRPPARIASALELAGRGAPGFPASERDVLSVLSSLLGSMDLCVDESLRALAPAAWMKETRLCTCNDCPYARQINWAILVALYPEAIPPLERSRHVAMLRTLARSVVRSYAPQEPTLRQAVYGGNLFLLELLEEEGFDLHELDGEMAASSFLELSDQQRMKDHLVAKGVRLRE